MSLLVKDYAQSIDYVMKNGKKIAEKGGKAVYKYVNNECKFLLSTKNGKPLRMITSSKLNNDARYTVVENFEKNVQVGIHSDEFKMVKHIRQQDPTWDIVNQDKLFSYFKPTKNRGLSVRIQDFKNKLAYQAFHYPWRKSFKVEKLEYPNMSSKEVEHCSDTSANGFENIKNFIRKYGEPVKVKQVETTSENLAKPAPSVLDKFFNIFNKNH